MAKVRREDIRHDLETDVVAETGRKLWERVRDSQNTILAVTVVLLVGFGAVRLVRWQRLNVLQRANFELAQVRDDRQQARAGDDPTARTASYQACEAKLTVLIKQFAGKPIGQRALYLSGAIQFEQLKFSKARDRFEQYSEAATDDTDRARATRAIGSCYENEAFVRDDDSLLEKAREAYAEATELGRSGYVAHLAMIDSARMLEADAETLPQALELLEKVVAERAELDDETDPEAQEIQRGPAPPRKMNLTRVASDRAEKVRARLEL